MYVTWSPSRVSSGASLPPRSLETRLRCVFRVFHSHASAPIQNNPGLRFGPPLPVGTCNHWIENTDTGGVTTLLYMCTFHVFTVVDRTSVLHYCPPPHDVTWIWIAICSFQIIRASSRNAFGHCLLLREEEGPLRNLLLWPLLPPLHYVPVLLSLATLRCQPTPCIISHGYSYF